MTDAVRIALIGILATTITTIGAVLIAWISLKRKVDDLHVVVDGRLTQLLELTAKSSEAKGVLKQQAQEITTQALITARELAKDKE